MPRITKTKVIALDVILLIFSLIMGLAISEIIAHRYVEANKLREKLDYLEKNNIRPKNGIRDKDLGWGYRPNAQCAYITSDFKAFYSINSKGIRDKEIPLKKPIGEFRILALGESNVYGEGVNYGRRFTEVIENSLSKVEVVNMGIGGFGADQSLLQLERDGLNFRPDLIVIFANEELLNRCKAYSFLYSLKPRFVLSDNKKDIYLQNLDFIKNKFTINADPAYSQGRRVLVNKDSARLRSRGNLFTILNYRKKVGELKVNDKYNWQNIWRERAKDIESAVYKDKDFQRLVYLLLKRYQDISAKHSAEFILVYVASDKMYFMNYLKRSCEDLGISFFDLSGILDRASRVKSLTFAVDPHYNVFAHRVIGEYTGDYIAKKYNLQRNESYIYKWLGKFD